MPNNNIKTLKQLREETGISMMECKKALDEAEGDIKRAKEILREKGKELVKDRGGREASNGLIISYIHSNEKIGVLLQMNCETDFVAKSKEFKDLGHEICLQIAASAPLYIKSEDIPQEVLDNEAKIYKKQMENENKPEEIINKIIEGKLSKYRKDICLLNQQWVKDSNKKIEELVDEVRAKTGEKVDIVKFARFAI